jgi:hypothetical protein
VKSSTAFRINDSVGNILLLADQTVQRSLTQTCIRAAEPDLECADSEGTGALSLTDGALRLGWKIRIGPLGGGPHLNLENPPQ